MQRFVRECGITAETRVLDIGGTPGNWQLIAVTPRLVLLNMPSSEEVFGISRGIPWVAADGRQLPFRDSAFDVVFSNSVIEHVGDAASQERFAREVARVGRAYWVQTPNRWFPIEQHLLTPFVHWLPKAWQRAILRRGTGWSALTHPSPHRRNYYVEHFLRDIRLLSVGELARLFPGARIIRERFLGLTKSLIAYRALPPKSTPR
jgi:SAM-dependent methyltransferase